MLFRQKYLCVLCAMMMLLFFVIASGGCGGSSSSNFPNSDSEYEYDDPNTNPPGDNDNGNQNQNPPDNNNNGDQNQNPPDNNGGGNENNSGVYDINGTWQVDSGAVYLTIPGLGTFTWPYVQGSASTFEISASGSTLKLIGDDVIETEENEFYGNGEKVTTWRIDLMCRNDNLNIPSGVELNLDNEVEATIYGSTQFTHPDSNSYEWSLSGASFIYRMTDNSTITYRVNYPNSAGNPDMSYGEFTLKRVQ